MAATRTVAFMDLPSDSARTISSSLQRAECRIPTVREMREKCWFVHDMVAAFHTARETIDHLAVRAADQHTPVRTEIASKWCFQGHIDHFQSINTFSKDVIHILLFDIWRDVLMLRLGVNEAYQQVGLELSPYVDSASAQGQNVVSHHGDVLGMALAARAEREDAGDEDIAVTSGSEEGDEGDHAGRGDAEGVLSIGIERGHGS